MQRYLVAFDTPSDSRRRALVKALSRYGVRVQKSVFLLQPRTGTITALERQLRVILTDEDALLVYDVNDPLWWWGSAHAPGWAAFQVH